MNRLKNFALIAACALVLCCINGNNAFAGTNNNNAKMKANPNQNNAVLTIANTNNENSAIQCNNGKSKTNPDVNTKATNNKPQNVVITPEPPRTQNAFYVVDDQHPPHLKNTWQMANNTNRNGRNLNNANNANGINTANNFGANNTNLNE